VIDGLTGSLGGLRDGRQKLDILAFGLILDEPEFQPITVRDRGPMQSYDLIIIGTGSAMNIVEPFLERNPSAKIAVIDKDPPGGICLTKGCIPTKMLVYPAELIRMLDGARQLGIHLKIQQVDFTRIMNRMHAAVDPEVENVRQQLQGSKAVDYFQAPAEFVDRNRLAVEHRVIASNLIVLCTGSRPRIPFIQNLENVPYYTSDTILGLKRLPPSMAIVGGGYIAAEYGHFFSAMGCAVTIIGRNSQFLPEEEPEISDLAQKKMAEHMAILTGHEVVRVDSRSPGKKRLAVEDRMTGKTETITAAEILLATGRESNSDLLHPERAGVETDRKGWIVVNDYLETTAANIWALGDAIGRYQFKHVANYESRLLYYNAILGKQIRVDYHAVPHAVFCYPEVAAVGMTEKQAGEAHTDDQLLIGFHRYHHTAKGEAMGVGGYFAKIIAERGSGRILGAHIIGPQASVLIQEIVTLMYSDNPTLNPILYGMHIHPALSEVVERACNSLMPPQQYHQMLQNGQL
jgi:mycothione reductase